MSEIESLSESQIQSDLDESQIQSLSESQIANLGESSV